MTACPEPDVLARFVDDALGGDARVGVEQHIDGCDECRSTVSLLARAAVAERGSPTTEPDRVDAALQATELARQSTRRLPQSPLAPGTSVGRYVIGDVLGIGGMGIVYAANDPDLGRDIAIKILRPEFARAHPDAARRIVREAQAMARVAHPNVVSVYDVGAVGDRVFVAMERVTGTSLRAWLAAAHRTPAEILEVFTAAGRGLVAAHDAGMVHRDFKPDNVLVGSDGRVRVTDFGLAFDEDTDEVSDDASAGTPAYMAPEQHLGGHVDARTDQFSFAVALYEALYGQRPFAGVTREALGDAVVHGAIDPPPAGARVPASVRAILVRALAVMPGERFDKLADMLEALRRDRSRRPRQLAAAAAVGLVAVAVALGADAIMRERTHAVTRTGFAAARAQLDRLVRLRTEAFVAQSDALFRLPALQEVVASRDLADFGLGDADEDRARIAHIHANLASADWLALTRTRKGDQMAIADFKGRILYASANADVLGGALTVVPVLAAAYAAPADTFVGVVEGDDPAVVGSGLLGGVPRPGMYVAFAHAKRIGGQPRAVYVQLIEAARVLQDVSIGEDTRLSVLAPDGRAEGTVPPELLARVGGGGIAELADGNDDWLAERTLLRAGEQSEAIAQIVLARRTDVGLSGLFPHARRTLAVLAAAFAALAIGALAVARRQLMNR